MHSVLCVSGVGECIQIILFVATLSYFLYSSIVYDGNGNPTVSNLNGKYRPTYIALPTLVPFLIPFSCFPTAWCATMRRQCGARFPETRGTEPECLACVGAPNR